MPLGDFKHPYVSPTIGEQGRYCLEQRLGEGGIGNVYIARDLLLGRQVAIKILKDTLINTEDIRKRFELEVSLCAALSSENIVQVTDYGITTEGNPFFVMEYLIGHTLGKVLQQHPQIDPVRTVHLITQVCHGLSLAHGGVALHRQHRSVERVQIIHRDLKPDNLFVVTTTLGELVKILDFGIAKLKTESRGLTDLQTCNFLGTYRYASPEQLSNSQQLDVESDIYSLGMILYEMLSGTDPFGLAREPYNSGMIWIKAHLMQAPTPLRSLPQCAHISAELEAVVMRCLAKDPAHRWSSVKILSQNLKAAIAGTAAMPDPLPEPTQVIDPAQSSKPSRHPSAEPQPLASNRPPSVPNPANSKGGWMQALEHLLTAEIGPIAAVLLPPALKISHCWTEIVDYLIQYVPELRRPAVRAKLTVFGQEFVDSRSSLNSSLKAQAHHAPRPIPRDRPGSLGLPPNAHPDLLGVTQHPYATQMQILEQSLVQYIGPIAKILVNQSFQQYPDLPWADRVQQLACRIPNSQWAVEFERSLLSCNKEC